jgi:hypothetical protein
MELRRAKFSTVPVGLLGLLGIKNDGQYPGILNDSLSMTSDMLEWLSGNYAREIVSDIPAAWNTQGTKSGAAGNLIVPQGQCWLVRGSNSTLTASATDFIRAKHVLIRPFSPGVKYLIRSSQVEQTNDSDTAGAAMVIPTLQGPFLMFPGDELCHQINKVITAGTIQGSINAWLHRFPL